MPVENCMKSAFPIRTDILLRSSHWNGRRSNRSVCNVAVMLGTKSSEARRANTKRFRFAIHYRDGRYHEGTLETSTGARNFESERGARGRASLHRMSSI